MIGVGDRAVDFTLKDVNGKELSLKELTADKPALLAFFKGSCPVCQLTLPFLERMAAGSGVEFVAISQDEPGATAQFRSRFGVTFTTLLDDARNRYPVSNAYGITSVPSLFLIEPDGQISTAVAGFSKQDMEKIGERAGVSPFRADEAVPSWRAG